MTVKQIVETVKQMILVNLNYNNCTRDVVSLMVDETNKVLLAHIKGIIALFQKAKEILERGKNVNSK